MKNKRKLNEQKTEVLFCGPSSRRESVPADCLSISEASIPFSNVVKTLGVTLDAELSMEQHNYLSRCQILFVFFTSDV